MDMPISSIGMDESLVELEKYKRETMQEFLVPPELSVEAPVSAMIGKIFHKEGENVPCNGVLAVIISEGESMPAAIHAMIDEEAIPTSEVHIKKLKCYLRRQPGSRWFQMGVSAFHRL